MLAKCSRCGKQITFFNDLRSADGKPCCNQCYDPVSDKYNTVRHNRCSRCGTETGFIAGERHVNGQVYCDECYFREMGEVFEKYPIGGFLQSVTPQPATVEVQNQPKPKIRRMSDISDK